MDGVAKIFEKANKYQGTRSDVINVVLLDNGKYFITQREKRFYSAYATYATYVTYVTYVTVYFYIFTKYFL